MNIIFFDDPGHDNLLPLTFTKPAALLRVGILTIGEKWEKLTGLKTGYLTKKYLSKKYQSGKGDDNLLINGRLLPDPELLSRIMNLKNEEKLYNGSVFLAARTIIIPDHIEDQQAWPKFQKESEYKKPFKMLNYPWEIFTWNGDEISSDFDLLTKNRKSASLNRTNQILGNGVVFVEDGAKAECAILNATTGPIYLGKNSEIMEGSVIRGPFALCEGSALKLSAKIYGPTTVGPYCKVGGEVNNSVFQAFSNKGHDGFLGNSVIGEWCNIGADSNNSNLKNNYAEVKLWNYTEEKFIKTGLQFCGLIMGDHSKCGINTMFNTGSVVGVNANIYGAGFPRNFIPSFSWGGPGGFTTYSISKAFEVAETVMSRRNIDLTAEDKNILHQIFELTKKYRN